MAEDQCTNCGSYELEQDQKSGDIVCRDCALVQAERSVDPGREWREFSDNTKDNSRVGKTEELLTQGALSTTVASTDANGRYARGPRVNTRNMNDHDKVLLAAFDKLDLLASKLKLSDQISRTAREIFAEFKKKQPVTLRYKQDALHVAVLCAACRDEGFPRTFKEVSKETQIEEKDIRKAFRQINKLLGKTTRRTGAPDLVARFCSKLSGVEWIITQMANDVANLASDLIEGKSPASIAAASILYACKTVGAKPTEKEIAEAASISATTIRNVYKDLVVHQDKLLALPAISKFTATPGASTAASSSSSSSSSSATTTTTTTSSATATATAAATAAALAGGVTSGAPPLTTLTPITATSNFLAAAGVTPILPNILGPNMLLGAGTKPPLATPAPSVSTVALPRLGRPPIPPPSLLAHPMHAVTTLSALNGGGSGGGGAAFMPPPPPAVPSQTPLVLQPQAHLLLAPPAATGAATHTQLTPLPSIISGNILPGIALPGITLPSARFLTGASGDSLLAVGGGVIMPPPPARNPR